jgi:hypothetical protein
MEPSRDPTPAAPAVFKNSLRDHLLSLFDMLDLSIHPFGTLSKESTGKAGGFALAP